MHRYHTQRVIGLVGGDIGHLVVVLKLAAYQGNAVLPRNRLVVLAVLDEQQVDRCSGWLLVLAGDLISRSEPSKISCATR